MQNANHHSSGEYRYCPERTCEVSLRGSCAGVGGLRFTIKGAKIRIGYFFRVFGMIGKSVRRCVAGLRQRFEERKAGYRSLDIRRAACRARL